MRAIEIKTNTDQSGHLKIDYMLNKAGQNVRVLILLDDDAYEPQEENLWMNMIANDPSFDFLHDPAEDIYSLNDGEPLND